MLINKLKDLRNGGDEEGFTLIELMIVVVIIGILAAIAIPIFANQQKSAIVAGVKSDVKNTTTNIVTALVKAPTSTNVTAISAVIVKSDSLTAITIAGTWDGYTVLGTNSGVNATLATVATDAASDGVKAKTSTALSTTGFGILYNSVTGKATQVGG